VSNVQSFIDNISFPTSLEELSYFLEDNGIYNVEMILDGEADGWTAPRWCKIGDIVFFMHTKVSAIKHIRELIKELENEKENYSEEKYQQFQEWLERGRKIHKKYGGKIFAVGRVIGEPKLEENDYDDDIVFHWESRIYADIEIIWQLENPVDISEFRDFIQIAMQTAITPVFGDSFEQLKTLIISKNPDAPKYFLEAKATPMPLARINKDNWLDVANLYRREFFLEIQFRKFYVDYFLSVLGDNKTFFTECRCQRADISDSFVDNIIAFNKKYLPVEVKLNIENEQDLNAQLQKYCNDDTVYSKHDNGKILPNEKFYKNNVLVFDTENIYLYDKCSNSLTYLVNLDDMKTEKDIKKLRETLIKNFSS